MDPIFEAYKQILRESIDLTNHKPKYTKEDKQAHLKKLAYKKVQDYIDSGSQGDLNLSYTQITSIPNNLTVGGNLDLRNTPITSLPDNLKVGGGLYLRNTQITSLPDNLEVGGGLYLSNTPITSLPDNLNVGGDLYLWNTQIASLPDNLKVDGILDLYDTLISKKYTAEELKRMLPGVRGKIFT
jgi:hypothetical protein